jgi:hypothetical protein
MSNHAVNSHVSKLVLTGLALGILTQAGFAASTSRLVLSPDQPSAGALADDPVLRDFVTFDLLVSSDADWTNSSLRFALVAGSFYNANGGGATPASVPQWNTAGSRHLRFDTFVAAPPGLAAGAPVAFARHILDGPGPAVFSPNLTSVAWLDTGSSYGPGTYTIARLTISSDAVGSFSGWSFDSANAGVGQPFAGAFNKQLRWDTNPSSIDAQGGPGAWNTSDLRFWNGSSDVAWDNSLRDVAVFAGPAGGPVAVDAVSADGLRFDAPGYVLVGGTISLTGSGRIAANAPAEITSNLSATSVLTKSGPAALTLSGGLAGLAGNLDVREGELRVGELAGAGVVAVAGGAHVLADHLRVAKLTLETGAAAAIRPGGGPGRVSRLQQLEIAGGPASPAAKLDLADNGLIVQGGDLAGVTALVASARNSAAGLWQGNGLTTSTAAPLRGLGVIRNDRGDGTPLYATFGGMAVDTTSVLVKFTYSGDTDLSGRIDAADYFAVDRGGALHLTGWANGDFDYSGGRPDAADYMLIDRAFLSSAPALATMPAATNAVPEPAACALLLAAALLRRRR